MTRRVLAANTALAQATQESERARLAVERARAGAVPNVTVGGGYSHDYAEQLQGAILSLDMALPLWDRKQGLIHEALAHRVRAQLLSHVGDGKLHLLDLAGAEQAFQLTMNARTPRGCLKS